MRSGAPRPRPRRLSAEHATAHLDALLDALDSPAAYETFSEVKCLGRGGFGQAMLMRHKTRSGFEMVTKRLPLTASSDEQLRTLENEVRVCARLRHTNIVHYLATFVRDETLLICLEYCSGGTLADRVDHRLERSWPFATDVATRWIAQIASAVAYMHSTSVLHRDLSANNVLLTLPPAEFEGEDDGDVKVSDFGLSKASGTGGTSRSLAYAGTTVCGTPNCFSPELVNGERYGAPADAWAVGLLAYEILTLQHPFLGGSLAALLKRICDGEYDAPTLEAAPHPPTLRQIASSEGLLHVDPQQRLTLGALLEQPVLAADVRGRARQAE